MIRLRVLLLFLLFPGVFVCATPLTEGFEGTYPPLQWSAIHSGDGHDTWT